MLSVRHAGNMYNYSLTYQARGIYLLSRVLFMLQVEHGRFAYDILALIFTRQNNKLS